MHELEYTFHQAQNGNLDAYATIVQRFQALAIGYAYAILGDYHLAEDAAQEAFLDAYQNLYKVYAMTAFPSWLRKVVFKHCDRMTRGKRVETVDLTAADNVVSALQNPIDVVEKQELVAGVRAAINMLPHHERDVVVLFYLFNHSQKEIAEFLDVQVSIVKNRLYSARNHLLTLFTDTLSEAIPPQYVARRKDFATMIIDTIKAAEQGDLSKLTTLLERHPHLAKAKNERPGGTALHYAALSGQKETAELLLSYGADINVLDDSHTSSPLGWAHENGQWTMVDYLIDKGAEVTFQKAASLGKTDILRAMLQADPAQVRPQQGQLSALHTATIFGQKESIELLLKNGAEVNQLDQHGHTALDIALDRPIAIYGAAYESIQPDTRQKIVALLLENGAAVNLHNAAALGRLDEVKRLLTNDATLVNAIHMEMTPIYAAALHGHADVVAWLIENGADIQMSRTSPGTTPLHAATWTGSTAIAQQLLDHGADIDAQTAKNAMPLHYAVWRRHVPLVRLLLDYGADVNVPDAFDHTPMSLAQTAAPCEGWWYADWGSPSALVEELIELLKNRCVC